jgi:hypothetical protein
MTPKNQPNGPLILTLGIFVLCLIIGYQLSLRRPLWNDEIFSQFTVVDTQSYQDILFFKIKNREGNPCPLFYLIQKAVSDLWQYKFPLDWHYEWAIDEAGSQVIMRLSSNIFMSLSIALLFYFFTHYYSLVAGIYSLLVTLSSFMVWAYWAEARPYALWFFLTTSQLLLFLILLRSKNKETALWKGLMVTHWLLSFTLILSAIQITIISAVLYLYQKEKDWKKYFWLAGVPLGICSFYYFNSMFYGYSLVRPFQLILRNVSWQGLVLFLMYCGFLIGESKKAKSFEGKHFGIVLVLMLVAALAFLFVMSLKQGGPEFASLSERYLIYLTPVSVIAIVLFSLDLVKIYRRSSWMWTNIVITLVGLLLLRFLGAYMEVQGI